MANQPLQKRPERLALALNWLRQNLRQIDDQPLGVAEPTRLSLNLLAQPLDPLFDARQPPVQFIVHAVLLCWRQARRLRRE